MVGLVEIVPVVVLALPAGQAADRFRRRNVAMAAHALLALCAFGFALVSLLQGPIWLIYALLFGTNVAGTFRSPTMDSMLPQLVPQEQFVNAVSCTEEVA